MLSCRSGVKKAVTGLEVENSCPAGSPFCFSDQPTHSYGTHILESSEHVFPSGQLSAWTVSQSRFSYSNQDTQESLLTQQRRAWWPASRQAQWLYCPKRQLVRSALGFVARIWMSGFLLSWGETKFPGTG